MTHFYALPQNGHHVGHLICGKWSTECFTDRSAAHATTRHELVEGSGCSEGSAPREYCEAESLSPRVPVPPRLAPRVAVAPAAARLRLHAMSCMHRGTYKPLLQAGMRTLLQVNKRVSCTRPPASLRINMSSAAGGRHRRLGWLGEHPLEHDRGREDPSARQSGRTRRPCRRRLQPRLTAHLTRARA